MPYDVTIDHGSKTITVTGHGHGTTADTLQLIDDQQETFRSCAGYNFIYDSSALKIESSPADMMRVAEALLEKGSASFRRFAIVVPEGRTQLARIFSALAHPYGVSANVFLDIGDARRWLGIDQD